MENLKSNCTCIYICIGVRKSLIFFFLFLTFLNNYSSSIVLALPTATVERVDTEKVFDLKNLESETPIRHRRLLREYECKEDEEDIKTRINHVKCSCPRIYAPVCGSDHITYHNRCFLHCVALSRQEYKRMEPLTVQKLEAC